MFFSRFALYLLSLFFLGCNSCRSGWIVEKEDSDSCYSHSLCYVPPCNRFKDIEFEFEKSDSVRLYLNLYGNPLPPGPISLTLSIDGTSSFSKGYVMDGGQRVVLEEEDFAAIVEALTLCQEVQITVGSYSTLMPVENFNEVYTILCG